MTPPETGDGVRRLRNLESVARHLSRSHEPEASAAAGGSAAPRTARMLIRLGPIGLALVFVLGKLKLLVPLVKFAKLGTLATMLVAIWAYAQIWGVAFAVGFVLLIFVHEMGHALVMRAHGIRAGAPVFIPFVGAVIAMKSLPRNAWIEALVGIGGPVLGSAGALTCLIIGWITGAPYWYALASTGFLINLFNLIPIHPLDGGRIVGVISRWLWLVGYGLCVGIFLVTFHPLLLLILLFGLAGLGRALRGSNVAYFDVEPGKRLAMGAAYFALAGLLALGMNAADRPLEALRDSGDRTATASRRTGLPGWTGPPGFRPRFDSRLPVKDPAEDSG